MADHFEEVIGLRVAALEARVAAEAESVKEHFAELQNFITFSLTRQVGHLKTELKQDIRSVEQQIESLDRKVDAHHEVMKLILADILSRLPARSA